jgi:hypothetical protein
MSADPGPRTLLDRAEISDVIGRYVYALDMRDWALFRSCFTDEIEFEPADEWARGAEKTVYRTDEWLEAVKAFMSEMPHSQHLKVPISFDFEGDRAVVISTMQGKHYMPNRNGEAISTVVGYYRDRWIRTADGWRQASLKEIILWHEGNWHVFDVAITHFQKAMANIAPVTSQDWNG